MEVSNGINIWSVWGNAVSWCPKDSGGKNYIIRILVCSRTEQFKKQMECPSHHCVMSVMNLIAHIVEQCGTNISF